MRGSDRSGTAPLASALMSLALAWGLTACGTTPSSGPSAATAAPRAAQPLPTLMLQGQISIKLQATDQQSARGSTLGFFFSGQPQAGQLDLMTPLGSQLAQVRWDAQGASLRQGGDGEDEAVRFGHLDELTTQVLGEPLPLSTLIHWMQGNPDPDLPVRTGESAGTFTQLDWLIDTRELPRHRLSASRPASADRRGAMIKVYLDH